MLELVLVKSNVFVRLFWPRRDSLSLTYALARILSHMLKKIVDPFAVRFSCGANEAKGAGASFNAFANRFFKQKIF